MVLSRLSNSELDTVSTALGHELPGLYRKLLVEEGFGRVGSIQIYHPREIEQFYEYHFEDPAELFHRWFPFGCDNLSQEIWIIDPIGEKAASIWHETHPDDYDEEEWLPYESWINRYLPGGAQQGGQGGLPGSFSG